MQRIKIFERFQKPFKVRSFKRWSEDQPLSGQASYFNIEKKKNIPTCMISEKANGHDRLKAVDTIGNYSK